MRLKVQVHLWRRDTSGQRLYALLHRCAAKGDYWQPITGNVDPGEAVEICARREANEEAGIESRPDDLTPCLWVQDWARDGKVFAEHVFGLRCASDKIVISGEHRAYEWLPYDAAIQRLHFEGNRRGLALVEEWLDKNTKSER